MVYRHPMIKQTVNIDGVNIDDGNLNVQSKESAREDIKELIIEMKINNLHNAVLTDQDFDEIDVSDI